MRPDVAEYMHRHPAEVRGWFAEADFRLFDWLLSNQGPGDLLEIGAYEGASAILLGLQLREGETFTVCDIFALPDPADGNYGESARLYGHLTRELFERNYRRFLPELPRIVQVDSRRICEHVQPRTCRFVHVDGSHTYEFVRSDLDSARALLADDGVVVFDDWRGWQMPGVTLSVMAAIASGDLHVVALTPAKLYCSGDPVVAERLREAAIAWAGAAPELVLATDVVRGEVWPRITTVEEPRRSTWERARRRLSRAVAGGTQSRRR